MKRFVCRCASAVWKGLVAFGAMHVGPSVLLREGYFLSTPPLGGPEQLVPDRPLTALEQSLVRELTGDEHIGTP